MKKSIKAVLFTSATLLLLTADLTPHAVFPLEIVPEAAAVVGVPWSPVSVAGVARRTTRRAVVYGSSVAAAEQQTAAQQQAATTQQAHRPDGAPPIGSVVAALPAGCAPQAVTIGGVQFQDCAGVYYRAAFQGNNLVYVVTQP